MGIYYSLFNVAAKDISLFKSIFSHVKRGINFELPNDSQPILLFLLLVGAVNK